MNLNELSQPKSSKALNESVARTFGQKLNIDSFTVEQLRTARDTLTTKIAEFETTSAYDAVFEDPTYLKNRALLDVITQSISERTLTPGEEKKKETFVKGMKGKFGKYGKKADDVMYATATKMAKTESLDEAMDILRGVLSEQVLTEGAEEEAALIMSSRDMVDRVTGWIDDIANMKAERLLELIDSIADTMGNDVAQQFSGMVKPALDQIYTVLEEQRQILAQAVDILTGEQAPTLGAETPAPDMGVPGEEGTEMPGEEMPATDEFGASAPAAGGSEPVGRMKRESVENFKKKV